MAWLEPVTLQGKHVRLEPLSAKHAGDLRAAVRDGELWKLLYTNVPSPDGMDAEIERRLGLQRHGTMLPFAVIDPIQKKAAGMTTYMHADEQNRRVEIGSTWYRKNVQRTALNTECKLLLLTHAFERLECVAVEFRTSSHNEQSRRAIERLGARFDGILRSHGVHADGSLRDTCVYSIIAAEWPAVRPGLLEKLAR